MWQAHEFMRRVGRTLRTQDDDFTHEPLPERWVELILHLEAKDRLRSENPQPEGDPLDQVTML